MTSKCINQYLDTKGIKKGNKGYIYLAEAIQYMIFRPNASLKEVYMTVSSKYGESASKVTGCVNYSLKALSSTPKSFIHNAVDELSPVFSTSTVGSSMSPFDILLLVNKCLSLPSIALQMQRLNRYHMHTFVHCIHVAVLAVDMAAELGVSNSVLEEVCIGALLHDVGKLNVPLEILNKPGGLTDSEFTLIKNHPQQSYFSACCANVSDMVKAICLLHHRYLNKTGYPDTVPREFENTPYSWAVDIVTICDIFSAIVSPRSYSDSETSEKAIKELESLAEIGKVSNDNVNILKRLVESGRTIIDLSSITSV